MQTPEISFEDFFEEQKTHVPIGRADLARALRDAGVRGYTKLKVGEMRELVAASPEASAAIDEQRAARTLLPRWAVRRSFGCTYGELAELEDEAGVTADVVHERRRGARPWQCYRCAEDVRRLFATRAAHHQNGTWLHVRVTIADPEADVPAADAFAAAMERSGIRVFDVQDYESREGGMMRYFDALVPSDAPDGAGGEDGVA